MKESMTPRERWLSVLEGKEPDRLPTDYWATPEVSEKLLQTLQLNSLRSAFETLHIDAPVLVAPRYIGPDPRTDEDVFGCRYRDVSYGYGSYRECISHPLAAYDRVEDIERNYSWPDPDWWDYSTIKDQIESLEHYPVRGGGSEPLLTYKNLRGQEQAFMDMVLRPEIVEYCLGKLFDLAYKDTERIYDQLPGRVDLTYVAEDMGSEHDLMMSPAHIEQFLFPGMRRMIKLAHDAGAYVFHHNDGAIRRIIPSLIEIGIDILNPIQWRCPGMDRAGLKRDFGQSLIFHGAVDNQQTLAFGTPQDVAEEVKENIDILGSDSRYIIAPCHNMQPVSSVDNVLALYHTAFEYGWR